MKIMRGLQKIRQILFKILQIMILILKTQTIKLLINLALNKEFHLLNIMTWKIILILKLFSKNCQLNFQKKMFHRSLKANEKKIKSISIQIIYLAVKI